MKTRQEQAHQRDGSDQNSTSLHVCILPVDCQGKGQGKPSRRSTRLGHFAGGVVRKAMRSRSFCSPITPASPTGITDVATGRNSSISARGTTVTFGLGVGNANRVGPSAADRTDENAAILHRHGVGHEIRVNPRARLGDVAINLLAIVSGKTREVWSDVAPFATNLVTARTLRIVAREYDRALARVAPGEVGNILKRGRGGR